MKNYTKLFYVIILIFAITLGLWACDDALIPRKNTLNQYPYPKREFRGVWISTLDYKDFPSKKNMSSYEQQQELKSIVQFQQQQGINAIIFQVRSMADAFYWSNLVPYSRYITGTEGQKPDYDPLALAIQEAHKQNIELHAWFNPYRATFHTEKTKIPANHITLQKPEWFIEYRKSKQFNPALPEVRQHLLQVVMEVVTRYDIDGVQFDDYFYPYNNPDFVFPDEQDFVKYGKDFADIHEWRRNNINLLIQMVSDSIKKVKPWVKFGVSPLGVWRNKTADNTGSATYTLHTSYDNLYADGLKWIKEGWIDYIAPQLYWSINHPRADYKELLPWWAKQKIDRHIYVGHGFYKIDNDDDQNWQYPSELPNQLRMRRNEPTISGSIFFRAKYLLQNPCGITDSIRNYFYTYPALIPAMPWKNSNLLVPPFNPETQLSDLYLKWQWQNPSNMHYFVVYRYPKKEVFDKENPAWIFKIQKENQLKIRLSDTTKYRYAVSACDRLHNESEPLLLKFQAEKE